MGEETSDRTASEIGIEMKYVSLSRNLEELESKLNSIFSGEDDTEVHRQRFRELADDLERSMEFLKNQIAAELTSHPNPPDRSLSRKSRRFDAIHSAITGLKSNLLPGLPFDCPHYDQDEEDEEESCCIHGEDPQHEVDEDEDESCCINGDQHDEVEDMASTFTKFYNNPIAFCSTDGEEEDDESSPKEQGENEVVEKSVVEKSVGGKAWLYWRPMLLGGLLGGLTVATAAASVVFVLRDHVRCQFNSGFSTGFPPPT